MCACVLKKAVSEVGKLIGDRDYVACRGLIETSSDVALKRLALRKERRVWFSSHLKGRYKYKLLDISLNDDGVLIASRKPNGDTASGSSLLNDDALFYEKPLGEYKLNSLAAMETSAQLATLDAALDVGASASTSSSTSTSLTCLKVKQFIGTNLEHLIAELQNKWRFNEGHRLWKYITGENKRELCFVSHIVSSENKLSMECKHRSSGHIVAFLEKLIELSHKASASSSHKLVIPAGAALAYKVQQLEINPNSGGISVPLGTMATSGDEGTQIDPEKEIELCRLYYSEFFGKLSKEKQDSLRKAIVKHLSFDAVRSSRESLNETLESPERESSNGSGNSSLTTGDATREDRESLLRLKKKAKAALPKNAEPKEEQIADLLQTLGVPGLLDLPKDRAAVYGIRYFITALLQLSPEVMSLLCNRVSDDGDGLQTVKDLESLIRSKANGIECEMLASFSHDTATDDDSFLRAWRATYVAAVHMCDLPVV